MLLTRNLLSSQCKGPKANLRPTATRRQKCFLRKSCSIAALTLIVFAGGLLFAASLLSAQTLPESYRAFSDKADTAKPVPERQAPSAAKPSSSQEQAASSRAQTKRRFPKTVVSLIVLGDDEKHLHEVLDHFYSLVANKQVKAGNLYITGTKYFTSRWSRNDNFAERKALRQKVAEGKESEEKLQLNDFDLLLDQIGVPEVSLKATEQIFQRYNIENSPTWVVRFQAQDYVLEGYPRIDSFFDNQGEFLGARTSTPRF